MYTGDLARKNENLDMTKKDSFSFQNSQHQKRIDALIAFIKIIDENASLNADNDAISLYQDVLMNLEKLRIFRNKNIELYEKMKLLRQIGTSIPEKIDLDFDIDEVCDISESFFDSISKRFGFQLSLMKIDNRVFLFKGDTSPAFYFPNNTASDAVIGVSAINKEDMLFSLTHELGHSIKDYETNNIFGETLPILLELYLRDFIQKNKINYNTIPYLNFRFITDRNTNIETLKQYLSVNIDNFRTRDAKKITREFYIDKGNSMFDMESVLNYLLATEIALDLYKKGEDKLQTIEELLEKERNIFNVFDLAEITSPDVMDNEETIKKLLRKQ